MQHAKIEFRCDWYATHGRGARYQLTGGRRIVIWVRRSQLSQPDEGDLWGYVA